MKICNNCGQSVNEQANFCVSCGSADFSVTEASTQPSASDGQPDMQAQASVGADASAYQTAEQQAVYNGQSAGQAQPYTYAQPVQAPAEKVKENVIAGIVGAFLFSLIGGLLYFVIYQCGFIAGICGLVIFILAFFGYGLFSKNKSRTSIAGLITSILMTIVMIFLAEYICLSFEIYQTFKTEVDITFFDAVRLTPEFLSEPEISGAVIGDLAIAYIFSFAATIGNIVSIVKARKNG